MVERFAFFRETAARIEGKLDMVLDRLERLDDRHFYNYSTLEAASELTAPNGTSLIGNSIEWIVERPEVCPASALMRHMWTASWQALFSR
jgi:hypothetical protein